jgi:hypothetical protein
MLEAGLLTALGIIWILCRFDLGKVAALATYIDIGCFILLPIMFMGTYAGMVTGMLACVVISLFLTIIRRTVTIVYPKVLKLEGERFYRIRWVSDQK